MEDSEEIQCDVGIIGSDSVGRNVVLHLNDHQFQVAAMGWGQSITNTLEGANVQIATDVSEFMTSLRQPRTVLFFGAGDASFDVVLGRLLPQLAEGDIVINAEASPFKDTARHSGLLRERGIHFLGLGLAGGAEVMRHGGVVMAGGGSEAIQRARPLLEALAVTVRDEPCVIYLETATAAHFVKIMHAAVELTISQLLNEVFDLLQRSLLLTDEELHDSSGGWHIGLLNGYLAEVSNGEFSRTETLARRAAETAWELGASIPTIEAAAQMQRVEAAEQRESLQTAPFRQPMGRFGDDPESVLEEVHQAFQAAVIIAYAQAMTLLDAASKTHGFQFSLHEISRAWKGCTRFRATLLDEITAVLQMTPDLPCLLSDDDLAERVMAFQENLRHAVWRAHELDLDVPALLASLDYLDSHKAAWLPTNLIQVPRQHAVAAVAR